MNRPHPTTAPAGFSGLNLLICLLLAAAILCVYWPVRNYDYVNYDDNVYILQNPILQKRVSLNGLVAAFTTPHATYWIPLTWLSYMLDMAFFGMTPGAFHVTNLVFHLLNAILVFVVFRKMTGDRIKSAAVAALFGLHPVHVESVAWVTERKDVLSTFFLLAALWAYIRYVEHPGTKRYVLLFLCFAMGIMSKPMLVTFPFVLLLLDYWPLNRLNGYSQREAAEGKEGKWHTARVIYEKMPLFAAAAAAGLLTFYLKYTGSAVRSLEMYPLALRIANASVSYVAYLGKLFWPFHLALPYPYRMHIPGWKIAVALGLLFFLTAASVRYIKKRPYLAVGWFWYLGTMVPVIGLVQAGDQAMADRFAYVPFIGLYMVLVWGGADLADTIQLKKFRLPAALALCLFLAVTTRLQLRNWKNSTTLFRHALEVTENNYIAHHNLAVSLAAAGRLDEAARHYSAALRINPSHIKSRINLGSVRMEQGRITDAISEYTKVLRSVPRSAAAQYNLGNALAHIGKLDEAADHYTEALKIDPDDADIHGNLANVRLRQGRLDRAILHYAEASRLDPENPYAKNNLGIAMMKDGKVDAAGRLFLEALKMKPDFADAQNNLGIALEKKGRTAEAIACFKAALRLNPAHPDAGRNMRLLMESSGSVDSGNIGVPKD